jgi:hypothetical protein
MAGKKVGNLDIQFGPNWDSVKANQLVQSLQQTISAVNTLASEASGTTPVTPTQQVLATQEALGPGLTVAGLEAGQVLIAESPTTAHFAFLEFGQLADTDAGSFADPGNGYTIQFVDGYWSAVPRSSGLGLTDPGSNALVMWNEAAHALAWALPGTGILINAGQISVDATQLSHSDLLNLLADDHPQYALVIDTPQLGTTNAFTALNTFAAGLTTGFDIGLGGNLEQSGLEGLEYRSQLTDDTANEGTWRLHVESGQLMFASVADPDPGYAIGSDGENWLYVQRIGELVDTIGFQSTYLTFNGFSLVAANPVDGADFLPLIVDGVTYYVVTSSEPLGGGGSSSVQFIESAGWNSSSGPVLLSLTVPQDIEIPYGSTLQEVRIGTQGGTGSCTITLGTSAFPISAPADITGGVPPAVSAGTSYANSTLTAWTTVFTQGAMIRATLTANSGFTSVKIYLRFK